MILPALQLFYITGFGVPDDIVSDRGRQFSSTLCAQLKKLQGIEAFTTTAYQLHANEKVEYLNRHLKAEFTARTTIKIGWKNFPLPYWAFSIL
ncbi:hypothetical protein RRG08_037222 [Elysia crispata]|uniref:Integrase catalytic domain-containing protein n=1 Tax=Elysia crispata TaxID=231223 RepID=A0AAE1DR22_9GAST|nr:hypothetical protein RRG08_037222 [Elysia crispata]